MRNIAAIAMKEVKSYFASPMAYVVGVVFMVWSGYFFGAPIKYEFPVEASLGSFFSWASLFLVLVSPALTMRLLSEEQSLGTIELLLTAPVRDVEVVLGKFLSSVAIFLAMLVLTLYYPLILFLFGDPDPGPIWSGYVIFLLAGGAWLSVGLFTSSFTGNQIVSWVLAAGILLGLWFIGSAGDAVGGTTGSILNYLSLSEHLRDSRFGLIDTRDIIYFVSMIITALFLTTRSLETRRWR